MAQPWSDLRMWPSVTLSNLKIQDIWCSPVVLLTKLHYHIHPEPGSLALRELKPLAPPSSLVLFLSCWSHTTPTSLMTPKPRSRPSTNMSLPVTPAPSLGPLTYLYLFNLSLFGSPNRNERPTFLKVLLSQRHPIVVIGQSLLSKPASTISKRQQSHLSFSGSWHLVS